MLSSARTLVQVPDRIFAKIKASREHFGLYVQVVNFFESWLDDASQKTFFPGYTDHGPAHVSSVLQSADELISDAAWSAITPADATVLTVATLAHDCALFLSDAGFLYLMSNELLYPPHPHFRDSKWSDAWRTFLKETQSLDDERVRALLGPAGAIRNPLAFPNEWTSSDRLLIGEFIRQHHARMALEFLVNGMPGVSQGVPFVPSPDRHATQLLELSGLVARSHGHPLRQMADLLRLHHDAHEYLGAHPVFLMALVRIADFLQIGPDRAKPDWLKFRDLQSPFSADEWALNQCVDHVRYSHLDPEAIDVQATPLRAKEYVRIREFLNLLQGEIDTCWAVLGETYGLQRHTKIDSLGLRGLKVRRIRSNIQDRHHFIKTKQPDYVPDQICFTIDDARLMQLLIGPLYNHDPNVGIRELVQNAVDAIHERIAIDPNCKLKGDRKSYASLTLKVGIDGQWLPRWVEIHDSGIGMNEEILKKFYFTIGSSFRNSADWIRTFSPGRGQGQVIRTGYFGIGVLAGFLLGKKISVQTRHFTSSKGLRFTFAVSDRLIDIHYCDDAEVGTVVRIEVSDEVRRSIRVQMKDNYRDSESNSLDDELEDDGKSALEEFPFEIPYFGNYPPLRVELIRSGKEGEKAPEIVERKFKLPPKDALRYKGWWSGEDASCGRFHLCHDDKSHSPFPFYVNGIGVEEVGAQLDFSWELSTFDHNICCSAYDPNRVFEFDLARTSVTLPRSFIASIEKAYWQAGIARFFDRYYSFLECPLFENVGFSSLTGHISSALAFSKRDYLPLGLVQFFSKSLIEISIRLPLSQGALEKGRGIRDHDYRFLVRPLRELLSSLTFPGYIFVNLSSDPMGSFDKGGQFLWTRPVEQFFAVHRAVKARRIFPASTRVNAEKVNEAYGLGSEALECFQSRGMEVTNEEKEVVRGLLALNIVAGITIYRCAATIEADDRSLPAVWRDIIGERGVPYLPDQLVIFRQSIQQLRERFERVPRRKSKIWDDDDLFE